MTGWNQALSIRLGWGSAAPPGAKIRRTKRRAHVAHAAWVRSVTHLRAFL